ncbi:hypothetical protein KI387_003004, partial [Taxus chinensis]
VKISATCRSLDATEEDLLVRGSSESASLEGFREICVRRGMPTRPVGPVTQDWAPVVLHKRPQKSSEARDPKAVNAAIRAGAQVETVKKVDGGQNKKTQQPVVNARKLDEETEPAALNKVSTDVRQAIQKARLEQKLSQADLAKRINERPQVVQEYESGKAVPNQAILAKMERALGVKLRGKVFK